MRLKYFILFLWFSFSSSLYADPVGMVTGSKTGTYFQFGKDIASISKSSGVDILVSPSKGSIDNIKRMMSNENAAFAIVQSDVLGYLSKSKNPKFKRAAKRLRLIFPFYNEEVHLLARKEIRTIKDLQGKTVVVGPKSSGTNMTAWNIFKMVGVKPAKRLNHSINDGIKMVLTGKVDAVFVVAGKPRPGFSNLFNTSRESVRAMLQKVHFVPLNDPALLAEYEPATLTHQDYSFVKNTVPTVSVKALLVSFNFAAGKTPYYKLRCKQLRLITKAIRKNLKKLKQRHHKKWKQVDLNGDMSGWNSDKCAHARSINSSKRPTHQRGSTLENDIECAFNGTC